MLTRKPANRIRRLAARSTLLAIAPGRSKSLCHSLLILQLNQSDTSLSIRLLPSKQQDDSVEDLMLCYVRTSQLFVLVSN